MMAYRRFLSCVATAVTLALTNAQSPCLSASVGQDLQLTDESNSAPLPLGFTFHYAGVAYTTITVCSNGYLWLGASAAEPDSTPSEAELLALSPRICPLWGDFNPGAQGSGHVYFGTPTPGVARITWAGVYAYGTTTPTSFQVELDSADRIRITFGNGATAGTANMNYVIGASPGGGAASNLVNFASMPLTLSSANFAQVVAASTTFPVPYAAVTWTFTPSGNGYAATSQACTTNALPAPAAATTIGVGCPATTGLTFFEIFAPGALDLSNRNRSFTPNGCGGYSISSGTSPTFFAAHANNLELSDDAVAKRTLPFAFPHDGASTQTIWISSNGFIALGSRDPGPGCGSPSLAALASGPPRIAALWCDLNPTAVGSGGVFADVDATTGDYVITWNGVYAHGSTTPNTFQIALSPTGRFTMRWQSVAATGMQSLVGYSSGLGAPTPIASDVSATQSHNLGCRNVPLSLAANDGSVPSLGNTFALTASGIAPLPNGAITILLLGTEISAVPLDMLGLAGCSAHIALPEIASFLNASMGNPTTSWSLALPLDQSAYGMSLMAQAVSSDLAANSFGFRVSNGLRWTFGL
ncbi:MAG: hypothetical protein RLZZ562_17 [Planctomycetota bacterium]